MVRPVPPARPHGRCAGEGVRGARDGREDERRRESGYPEQPVPRPRHPNARCPQERRSRRHHRRRRRQRRHQQPSRQASGLMAEKVVIIGSGPAGLTAALYSARANLKPVLIEGLEAGGQLMLTTLVENWPGFRDGIMGPELMEEMRVQAERFGAQVSRGHVTSVNLKSHPFYVKTAEAEYTSRAVIIATGASARLL